MIVKRKQRICMMEIVQGREQEQVCQLFQTCRVVGSPIHVKFKIRCQRNVFFVVQTSFCFSYTTIQRDEYELSGFLSTKIQSLRYLESYGLFFPLNEIIINLFHLTNLVQESSSYSVYSTHRKPWSRSEEGKQTASHTHRGECGQRVF